VYFDRRLWRFTEGLRLRIVASALLGILAVAAGTARLALLGWLLARVLAGAPLAALVLPVAGVAGLVAVRAALEYARTMLAHHTAARVQARLRETLYDHVTRLGPAHFVRERTGDVMVALVEGVQQLEIYFGQYLPQVLVTAATPFLVFGLVAAIDGPVALVFLVTAVVTLVAPSIWHRLDSRRSRERQQAYGAFAAELLDALQGLATLKAFGQSGARAARLAREGEELFRRTMGVLGTNTLARGLTDTGIAVGAAAALALGAYRVRDGDMTLAALLVVLMLGIEVFRPLRELRVLLHQGMLGLAAAGGITRVLAAEPLVREPAGPPVDTAALPPTLAFERVAFAYPGSRRPAHTGLHFTVAAGERVAIVGPSGSGKSTVLKLLLRFYDPQDGHVRVGGRDVRELGLDQLRSRIAVVSQDTYLFHGTVEENLRMGKPDATPAELAAAARAASAHAFIEQLPHGYATVVGERGVRLSGGQRQRIAIARALLRDAPILVLDEALSSVDAESEAAIQTALDRLMEGRTTLICAHRLSSVIGADRILVLDQGRVVESGRHAALLARGGAYARLMAGQVAEPGAGAPVTPGRGPAAGAETPSDEAPPAERDEAVLRAEGLGWGGVIRVLLGLSRGHRGRLAVTFGLGVARVTALVGVGVASALTVRALARGEPFGGWLLLLGAVAPLAGLLHWLESWLAHDVAYRLLLDMRIDLFRKLEALAPAYLTRRRSGDLVGMATHDVELIEYFFAHTITPVAVAVLVPAVVLATLLAHRWEIAVVLLPFLAYAALTPVLRRRRIDRLGARAREASGELNAHAVDTIQGLEEILAFQQVRRRGEAFAARARTYVEARMPFLRDVTRESAIQEAVTALGGLAVAGTGAVLAAGGALDPGALPLLTLLALSAFVPIWEVAQVGRQLADTFAATRRLHAVHAEPVPVRDGPGVPAGAPGSPLALELAEVTFTYPGTYPGRARPALAGVTFSVPRGSRVAVVGPSGAGKTTVAHLLLRFWDPEAGSLRLFGHDLRAYRLDELRRRIALVAQDTYLFNDTLRANVLLARPDASPAELQVAVEQAALGELVASLPDGLDTPVGERGAQLSGGQRQRVAIARAFLKDAPVLLLDEATSHLDAVNEQAVHDALDRLSRGRTTLVIAHRLSTVRDADRIVVLDEGRVAEIGRHAELLGRGGLYARLVHHQLAAVPAVGA
jgi:ATP-binding cassette, subfamily C, bacterial CydCD